ncbi:OmpH family outer membrane protein [Hymenobacter negativus]|uniref:OmpH family outer membrane protein n=1 Tax=Hymenobacter negativus TaxID=2795026 RepID=A0ABS0Q959_9BACT|nr:MULTISPECIES: OmpH family outer membrane protein [Bacteria]MBH8559208.1 OmpH family outer membrane protein [Hymenobacter negativus]MBH8569955.1 OmpH family outer membrane protein [Hymenobacter negativus]MBR7209694.1 OmpH family outer membrane protein [Microvirga sp. STS02]
MKNFGGLLLALLLLIIAPEAHAQKFGWVDSEFIMAKMPEYAKAQQELNLLSDTWQKEIETLQKDLDKLHRNYQNEEVVLTEAMKKKRQDEILLKEQELKAYRNKQFGYEGQLFKKRQELNKPVQDKVFEAVEKVAKKKSLAVVFDKSGDLTMLYTNPAHDYTEFVLEELGLGAEDRNQPGPKGAVKTVAPPKTPVDPNFESDSGTPDAAPGTKPVTKPARPTNKK